MLFLSIVVLVVACPNRRPETLFSLQILDCRQEMIHRYPDQEATMGEARLVGETGPDEAGKRLTPTTIKVSCVKPELLF